MAKRAAADAEMEPPALRRLLHDDPARVALVVLYSSADLEAEEHALASAIAFDGFTPTPSERARLARLASSIRGGR